MIPVLWLSLHEETPNRGYWDQALLEDIFGSEIWTTVNSYSYKNITSFGELGDFKGAVIVIPARYHSTDVGHINRLIQNLKWCLIILTGDEEAIFPYDELEHDRMLVYVMSPHPIRHNKADRFLPNGYSSDTRRLLKQNREAALKRRLPWFFAGQITHARRRSLTNALQKLDNGVLIKTAGFTQGVSREEYFELMASSKVAPCPSGAVVPDTFRLWEALEAGCLPLVDAKAPNLKFDNYWEYLLSHVPFPTIKNWKDVKGHLQYFYDTFPENQNKVFAWWQKYKRELVYELQNDIEFLSKETAQSHNELRDNITVLVPTSPIKSHPETFMIEETINSVRKYLPDSEIILMIDGIRKEQVARTKQYQEYVRRLLWLTNFEFKNVLPLLFSEHKHQVAMTREALKHVKTPNVLYVEHDTPLCEEIPFKQMTEVLNSKVANVIRLHHEAIILSDHSHLMLANEPEQQEGIPLIPTAQWSQRPHLARTEFYERVLEQHFTPNAICMIEDGIHGPCAQDYLSRGKAGWNDWKVYIYAPGGDMKRSYNLDGRKTDPKYDDTFIY